MYQLSQKDPEREGLFLCCCSFIKADWKVLQTVPKLLKKVLKELQHIKHEGGLHNMKGPKLKSQLGLEPSAEL